MKRAILASAIFWPIYMGAALFLDLIGLVLIFFMARSRAVIHRRSMIWPSRLVEAWKGGWLTWLWGNEEDGVTGPDWWWQRNSWPAWKYAYVWSALRNPTNNLRFIPGINPVIDPARVDSRIIVGDRISGWFCWQGLYAGLCLFPRIGDTVFRFWIGWKLKPEDAQGVADDDMRKPRCGFAVQFKRVS